jgi:hypothetical protein
LPDQAQLGLQQSQNRVAYPALPLVGGTHVAPVLELDEAAAEELDAAVVEELLGPVVVVEELLGPVVAEELSAVDDNVVVDPPFVVVVLVVLPPAAVSPPAEVPVEVPVEWLVEGPVPVPPLPPLLLLAVCEPASQPNTASPANVTAPSDTRKTGLVNMHTPPI